MTRPADSLETGGLLFGRTGDGTGEDLSRAQCLAIAIRIAFPLPPTGRFADLIAALDDDPREHP